MSEVCIVCGMGYGDDKFCSRECSRLAYIAERLKKIEGVLIEIKYRLGN